MNYKKLGYILLFVAAIGCDSKKDNSTVNSKNNTKNEESVSINKTDSVNVEKEQDVNFKDKVNQEDALKGLEGDDKDAATWLYENYKGRLNQIKTTKALSEMGEIAFDFVYDDGDSTKTDSAANAYREKYKSEINLLHFSRRHACMHGFIGADETNPYFTEFEFIGKTEYGEYAFNCTFTAENTDVRESKYVEVIKEDSGFCVSMIRCRKAI